MFNYNKVPTFSRLLAIIIIKFKSESLMLATSDPLIFEAGTL